MSGGNPPYQFGVESGTLPPGVALNATTGSVSGKPTATGAYNFAIIVTDGSGNGSGNQKFAIDVANGSQGGGIQVSVTPSSVTLYSNQTQQFTATVSGTKNTGVTWSATKGSIDQNGLYTAPQVNQQTNVTVVATSVADTSKQANANVTVQNGQQQLSITTGSLPDGQVGSPYSEVFTASGGTQPYTWSATGNLPPGLSLNSSSGELGGTPSKIGTYNFTVTVTDAKNATAQKNFGMNVTGGSNFDGPAELPRVYLQTSMADTPAPGTVTTVPAGGDVQAALNNAHCGDTVQLQAGASFAGPFKLPAKSCDDQHWIIVRTSTADGNLPAEGTRMTPCYAGVQSLPGRPQYQCSGGKNVLAQIVSGAHTEAILVSSGASHYRLIGLELTRQSGTGWLNALVLAETAADKIILDRVWAHGTAQDETSRGVYVSGMTNIAVIDSYLNDFHCTSAVGACTDAQAISGGNGDYPAGPLKIVDNFLEASGQSILFGGTANSNVTIADVEIRHNHLFKPMLWMQGQPGYIGGKDGHPFIVKNHFELKNAQRVLFEGNVMENNWGGFTQSGYSIVVTARFQVPVGGFKNGCPNCQVTDVTVRYCTISHVGAGLMLADPLTKGYQALAGERFSVHDITIDDVDASKYTGHGTLFLIGNNWQKNVLNSVAINHVTGFPDINTHMISLLNPQTNPAMWAFNFTNNLTFAARYSVWSAGRAGDCASSDVPITALTTCFSSYAFSHNAVIAPPSSLPPSKWPTGNFFPVDVSTVQFVNYNNGNGGDYHLQPTSPYKNAGTDGKDLGADIDAIDAAIAGVY